MSELGRIYRDVVIVCGVAILLALVVFLGIIPWAEQLGRPAYLDVAVEEGVSVTVEKAGVADVADEGFDAGFDAGHEYRNGVYAMEPGEYRAVVRAEGAEELVLDLMLAGGQTAGVYPVYQNGEWRLRTTEELARREAIVGVMPISFTVCDGAATRMNCDAIKVTYENARIVITGRKAELTDETLAKVKEELNSRNYNLDDYRYIYVQDSN